MHTTRGACGNGPNGSGPNGSGPAGVKQAGRVIQIHQRSLRFYP